jgi:hypothetical protein
MSSGSAASTTKPSFASPFEVHHRAAAVSSTHDGSNDATCRAAFRSPGPGLHRTGPCREREVSAPQGLSGRCDRRPPHGHRRSAKHHSICFDVRRETETPDAIPQDKQFDASNFTQV